MQSFLEYWFNTRKKLKLRKRCFSLLNAQLYFRVSNLNILKYFLWLKNYFRLAKFQSLSFEMK